MAMEKVLEVPTAKMASKDLARWKRYTSGKAKKKKLANGWYAIYADTSQLNPAARMVLGF